MKRNFRKIGIYGWNDLEPAILAAIAAGESVLFVGSHGSNKTEGAEIISKSILGKECVFNKYDVPLLQIEDLLGYPNPVSLSKGEIEYIHTPLSVWTPDAILLDEINRTNLFIQAKLMELVRNKTVMGKKTNLKIVFGAVNPPEKYNSGYMDLAVASRFSIFNIDSCSIPKRDMVSVIRFGNKKNEDFSLAEIIERARNHSFSDDQDEAIAEFVLKIENTLSSQNIVWSVRQAHMLHRMMRCLVSFDVNGDYSISPFDISVCVQSTIPQIHGLTSSDSTMNQRIVSKIVTLCSEFSLTKFHDVSVLDYASRNVSDNIMWASEMMRLAESEHSIDNINRAAEIISSRHTSGDIPNDVYDVVSAGLSRCVLSMKLQSKTGPMCFDEIVDAVPQNGNGGVSLPKNESVDLEKMKSEIKTDEKQKTPISQQKSFVDKLLEKYGIEGGESDEDW